MHQFQVVQKKFTESRIVEAEQRAIEDGEILVKVEKFAYTANNITYAVAGDMIGYWQFFPAEGEAAKDWGVIPVWGFAEVVESKAEGVPVGERLYGYFPPASHLIIQPIAVKAHRLIDGSKHRSALPAAYNLYRRVAAEPGYDSATDKERMLLYPLHLTSYCLWDALQDKDWYGSEQVVVLSASSKTSLGLAYALHQDENAPKTIGVTSARNLEMVESLGWYDEVLTYDAVRDLDASKATVIVDMSGNKDVLLALYDHLGDNRKYCINVGLTHWAAAGMGNPELAERSEFFFAPGHLQKRIKEWGAAAFDAKTAGFLKAAAAATKQWLEFESVDGLEGLAAIHEAVCKGQISPSKGLVVEM